MANGKIDDQKNGQDGEGGVKRKKLKGGSIGTKEDGSEGLSFGSGKAGAWFQNCKPEDVSK